jgi:hypothetical protein
MLAVRLHQRHPLPMHNSKRCPDLLCGTPNMHELETCLVDIGVVPTKPCAAAAHIAVGGCHGHVLDSRHCGDLRKNAILAMHVRARESQHKSSRRLCYVHTPCLQPKMTDSANAHDHTFEICRGL